MSTDNFNSRNGETNGSHSTESSANSSSTIAAVTTPGVLFAGERILHGAGTPALTWFGQGDPTKPLVLFVPGSAHNARIAYGGHEGGRAEDFLAHWVTVQGYNFLGVSYPLLTQRDHSPEAHPDFTIRSWGRQGAEIAAQVIAENELPKKIILVVWSNGGRSPQAFTQAATELGLEVEFCVSFSATPPNACITVLPPENLPPQVQKLRTPNGYIDLRQKYDEWFAQVQNNRPQGQLEIIPRDIYYNDYVGQMPVNLLGQGMMHHQDGFVASGWSFMEDSKGHDLASFPLMTTILTDNIVDARHALTDQALWSPFQIGHLYARYIENRGLTATNVAPDAWHAIVSLLRSAPQHLSVETYGNHLFFVGEAGARQAAIDIGSLAQRVQTLLETLNALLPLPKSSAIA